MTDGQYTVVMLIVVLFSLEVARSKTVRAWLVSTMNGLAKKVAG